jgi:hypothetical protein
MWAVFVAHRVGQFCRDRVFALFVVDYGEDDLMMQVVVVAVLVVEEDGGCDDDD